MTDTPASTGDMPVRELRIGDLVHAHGMLCRVIDAPVLSVSHGPDNGGVYWTSAVVENRADVSNDQVPYSFTPADDMGRYRWSLQGNDLAIFTVERRI